jgi:hypothetical protein
MPRACRRTRRAALQLLALCLAAAAAPVQLEAPERELPAANYSGSLPFKYPSFRAARPNILRHCHAAFHKFMPTIHEDLLFWAQRGVGAELLEQTVRDHTVFNNISSGVAFGFKGGKAYVLGDNDLGTIPGWFSEELVIYAHVFEYLAAKYGRHIPDVLFVLGVNDEPAEYVRDRPADAHLPIFRWAPGAGAGLGAWQHPPLVCPGCLECHWYWCSCLRCKPFRPAVHIPPPPQVLPERRQRRGDAAHLALLPA